MDFLYTALTENNIPYPPCVNFDGFTRWGKNKRYWLFPVGEGYIFGDWSQNTRAFAFPKNAKTVTSQQLQEIKEKIHTEQQHFKNAQKIEQIHISDNVTKRTPSLFDAPKAHEYLKKKHILPLSAKYDAPTDNLVIPLYDTNGKIWSWQTISSNGKKYFLNGGRTKGCFHPIGDLTPTIIVCEGFATAATIYQATGLYTIAAMNAGNIEPVVDAISKKYPSANIIIAADNDWEKEVNIGKESAKSAAKQHRLKVILPPNIRGVSDFNDIHVRYGIDTVKNQLQGVLS